MSTFRRMQIGKMDEIKNTQLKYNAPNGESIRGADGIYMSEGRLIIFGRLPIPHSTGGCGSSPL